MAPPTPSLPSLPCKQSHWILATRSLQHRISHQLRHLPPSTTDDFAKSIDQAILVALAHSTGIDFASCSDFTQRRLRLPLCHCGAGVRLQHFRRHIDYIGGICQGIPKLFTVTDVDGFESQGRLSVPSLLDLFGHTSFDTTFSTPWAHILAHYPQSTFARALQDCHSALSTAFRQANAPCSRDRLCGTAVASLGIDPKGKRMPKPSHTYTTYLEKMQFAALQLSVDSQVDSDQTAPLMERLAFHNCDAYSTAIFVALPRKGTLFTDRQFPECIRTVFGLPSPTFSVFEGQHIGSGQTKCVVLLTNTVSLSRRYCLR